jgi:hypothetical protein
MRKVGVAVSKDQNSAQCRIFFSESDVRRACGMLLCGDSSESCIDMMEEGKITCELCYAVLTALRKYPVKIESVKSEAGKKL